MLKAREVQGSKGWPGFDFLYSGFVLETNGSDQSTLPLLATVEELQNQIFHAATPDEIERLSKLHEVRLKTVEHKIKVNESKGSAKRDWWKVSTAVFGAILTSLQAYTALQTTQAKQVAGQAKEQTMASFQLQLAQRDTRMALAADPTIADRVQPAIQQDTQLASDFLSAVPRQDSQGRAFAIAQATGKNAVYIHAQKRDEKEAHDLEADLRRRGYISWVDLESEQNLGQSRLDYFHKNTPLEAEAMRSIIQTAGGFLKDLTIKPNPNIENRQNTYGLWIKSFDDLKQSSPIQK